MIDLDFRRLGACRDPAYNPDWWTASQELERGYARYVCERICPARLACDAWARANMQLCDGAVYGGVYYTSARGWAVRVAGRQPPAMKPNTLDLTERRYFRFYRHAARIQRWQDEGLGLDEISRLLRCNYKALSKWLNRRRRQAA